MLSGLCDGDYTLIASKLHEAFTIICICLPQHFVMDFRVQVRPDAVQKMGMGPFWPGPTGQLQNTLS